MLRNIVQWMSRQSAVIAVSDQQGHFLDGTPEFARLLEIESTETLRGRRISDLLQSYCEGDYNSANASRLASWLQDTDLLGIEPVTLTGRDNRAWIIKLVPQFADRDQPSFWLWLFEDTSESLRVEQHLAHSEKMDVISRFAGGMAHEFNNLLTIMQGNLDLIRAVPEQPVEKVLDRVAAAEISVHRANRLIRELRMFASRDAAAQSNENVVQVVREVCDRLSSHGESDASVTFHLCDVDEADLCATINAAQLEEALFRLGENALDAVAEAGEAGTVRFSLRIVVLSGRELLQIVIEDSGSGMPQSVREQAFEPFYTTKDPAVASGLGMAVAYGLIQEMGGIVQIDDSTPAGTEIRVTFPLVAKCASKKISSNQSHHLVVAFVDERAASQEVGRRMLRLLDHRTEIYSDTSAVVDAVRSGGKFDVILLQETIAGECTDVAYADLREADSEVRIIIIGEQSTELNSFCSNGIQPPDGLLETPYSVAELSQCLAIDPSTVPAA